MLGIVGLKGIQSCSDLVAKLPILLKGAVSEGGQVQQPLSNGGQMRRGRGPREKYRPELNFNVVESETRRKYKILYVSSLKSSDITRQALTSSQVQCFIDQFKEKCLTKAYSRYLYDLRIVQGPPYISGHFLSLQDLKSIQIYMEDPVH